MTIEEFMAEATRMQAELRPMRARISEAAGRVAIIAELSQDLADNADNHHDSDLAAADADIIAALAHSLTSVAEELEIARALALCRLEDALASDPPDVEVFDLVEEAFNRAQYLDETLARTLNPGP